MCNKVRTIVFGHLIPLAGRGTGEWWCTPLSLGPQTREIPLMKVRVGWLHVRVVTNTVRVLTLIGKGGNYLVRVYQVTVRVSSVDNWEAKITNLAHFTLQ